MIERTRRNWHPMAAARSRLLWQKVASPRLSGCAVRWASSFHCSTAVAEGGIPRSVSRQNSNALRLTPAPSQQTPLQPAQRTYARPGAQPAADGVKQHVAAHQPAVRLRVRAEDHALVQHVDRPPARSSSTMPATSQTKAAADQTERQPCQRQQQQTHAAGRLPQPAIRQMPGAHRRQRAHRADRAERPHCGMAEVERRPLSGNTSELQKRLKAPNISSANMPRICSVRSCSNRLSIERSSAG